MAAGGNNGSTEESIQAIQNSIMKINNTSQEMAEGSSSNHMIEYQSALSQHKLNPPSN